MCAYLKDTAKNKKKRKGVQISRIKLINPVKSKGEVIQTWMNAFNQKNCSKVFILITHFDDYHTFAASISHLLSSVINLRKKKSNPWPTLSLSVEEKYLMVA